MSFFQSIIKSTLFSVVGRVIFQIIYLYQLKFGLDLVSSNNLILIIVPALGFAYFAKSGINAVIIKLKDINSFNGAKTFNDIIFILLYVPYLYMVGNDLSFISFLLTYLSYSILVYADKCLFFRTKKEYVIYNNVLYIILTIFVLFFEKINFNINSNYIYLIFSIILLKSVLNVKINKENLKDILIVQSGNIISSLLSVIHAGRLIGLNLTNFTLGRSLGEFPFNFFGYHFSNFIHKNGLGKKRKKIYNFSVILLAIYFVIFFGLFLFHNFFSQTIDNNLLLIFIIFILLFPLQIINTIFARQMQKNNFFTQGTIIQVVSNSTALLALFLFGFNILNIYMAYYFTFMFGSFCCICVLKYHNGKFKIS